MPKEIISRTLEELKDELKKSPRETAELEQAIDAVQQHDAPHEVGEQLHTLLETLRREVTDLEMEHPRISALIGQLAAALSSLGI
jgi:ABC-type transporter Mla subunit MlaD